MLRRFACLVALLGCLSARPAVAAPVLTKILEDVKTAYNKQLRPMVVFDLEGTLFDNRQRTLQILKEYGDQELKSVRPDAAAKIATLTTPLIQYMLTDTLQHIGVAEEAVINNAAVFWSQRFFTDDYLKYDAPIAGAVNFVRNLYSAGARIVYLSSRDAPRQLLGTVKQLRDYGFPIGIQGTELILKPSIQTPDAVYKQQTTQYLNLYGKTVAAFDSEPNNVNVYRRAFGEATVVLFSAPHQPNAPPLIPNIDLLDKFE